MLILRVEDNCDYGPWFGKNNPWKYLDRRTNDHLYNVVICIDAKKDIPKLHNNLFIGLESPKFYEEWFLKQARIALEKTGYCVYFYKIHKNSVKFGKRQLAFDKSKAIMLTSFKPTDLKGIKQFYKWNR